MNTRSLPRVGAVAAVSIVSLTACASVPLGVSPESVLTAVIANLPAAIPSTSSPSSPSRPSRGGSTTAHRIPASPAPSSEAQRVLRTADSYVGVKYVWGGNTPREGFDCSGFTKYVFAKYGITLPRTSREQAHVGSAVPADFRSLRPGDLMMFAEPGQAISHVAIYAGNGVIVHSSTSTGGVGYTDLNTGGEWFVAYFVAARRVL
jgi:cell wall-associated NlpC family hydrolase